MDENDDTETNALDPCHSGREACPCVVLFRKCASSDDPGRPAYSCVALNRRPRVPYQASSRVSEVKVCEMDAFVLGLASARILTVRGA